MRDAQLFDSSLKPYSAMVYLKNLTKERCFVCLLFAKSKVTLRKTLITPRLELLGFHLLSKFVDSVKRTIEMIVKVDELCFWTNSEMFFFVESNLSIRVPKLGWRIGQIIFVL